MCVCLTIIDLLIATVIKLNYEYYPVNTVIQNIQNVIVINAVLKPVNRFFSIFSVASVQSNLCVTGLRV